MDILSFYICCFPFSLFQWRIWLILYCQVKKKKQQRTNKKKKDRKQTLVRSCDFLNAWGPWGEKLDENKSVHLLSKVFRDSTKVYFGPFRSLWVDLVGLFWVVPHFSNYAFGIWIFISSFSMSHIFSSISITCLFRGNPPSPRTSLSRDVLNAREPWGRR